MVMPTVPLPHLSHAVAEQALAHFAEHPLDVMQAQAFLLREEQPELARLVLAVLSFLDSPYAKYDVAEGAYLTLFLLQAQARSIKARLPVIGDEDCVRFIQDLRAEIGDHDSVFDVAERWYATQVTVGNPELAWAMNEVMRYRVEKGNMLVGIMTIYGVFNSRLSHISSNGDYEAIISA